MVAYPSRLAGAAIMDNYLDTGGKVSGLIWTFFSAHQVTATP
jgi:hypothetical protein